MYQNNAISLYHVGESSIILLDTNDYLNEKSCFAMVRVMAKIKFVDLITFVQFQMGQNIHIPYFYLVVQVQIILLHLC